MKRLGQEYPLVTALGLSNLVSAGLFVTGAVFYDAEKYWYLNWNLLLAGAAPLLAIWLVRYLKTHSWLAWQSALLTVIWLGFLPNSFYIVSDFIHLQSDGIVNPLFIVVMLMSFSLNGLIFGFMSVYIIHKKLVEHLTARIAHYLVAAVLLLCSFAIYLGRYLRWNTWDVLVNPAGLLFDVSDRVLINPSAHPQTFVTTAIFFALLGSSYIVIWQAVKYLKTAKG